MSYKVEAVKQPEFQAENLRDWDVHYHKTTNKIANFSELIEKLHAKALAENVNKNHPKIGIEEFVDYTHFDTETFKAVAEKVSQIISFIEDNYKPFSSIYNCSLLPIASIPENQQIIEINGKGAGNATLQLNQVPNEPKQQKLRRSTRKRKATSKLENKNKKFAAEENPENNLSPKDLYFFKLSLMPVKNKSTTKEVEKETIRPIEIIEKSETTINIVDAYEAVTVADHKQYVKQQLETESRKSSLFAEAVQVESESISTISSQQSNDKHTFENHDHTYAKLDDKEERKKSLDSGIISPNSEDYCGLLNTQKQENEENIVNLDIEVNDPESILAEYKRLRSESECAKQNYVALKLKENPINIEYNPKKSRKQPINADDKVAEAREKNNIASRLSRHKKKVYQQHLSFCVEYYTKEYEILTSFKEYSMKIEKELEKAAAERAKL